MYVLLQVAHSQLPPHKNTPQSQWCLLPLHKNRQLQAVRTPQSQWCLLQSQWCLLQLPPHITSQLNTHQVEMIISQYRLLLLRSCRAVGLYVPLMYVYMCIDNVLTVFFIQAAHCPQPHWCPLHQTLNHHHPPHINS